MPPQASVVMAQARQRFFKFRTLSIAFRKQNCGDTFEKIDGPGIGAIGEAGDLRPSGSSDIGRLVVLEGLPGSARPSKEMTFNLNHDRCCRRRSGRITGKSFRARDVAVCAPAAVGAENKQCEQQVRAVISCGQGPFGNLCIIKGGKWGNSAEGF